MIDAKEYSRVVSNYTKFVAAVGVFLRELERNPTPASVRKVVDDLQALTLDQPEL